MLRPAASLLLVLAAQAQVVDIGADTILSPPQGIIQGVPYFPRAVWHNYGDTAVAFRVWFQILDSAGGEVYLDSADAAPLQPGHDSTIIFRRDVLCGFALLGGDSVLCRCSTAAAGDVNPANDTFAMPVEVGMVSI